MPQNTDTYRSIHSVIAENAARIPDKVYVHCIDQDKSITWGELLHAANGEALARFADLEIAMVTCRQNELEPVSVH